MFLFDLISIVGDVVFKIKSLDFCFAFFLEIHNFASADSVYSYLCAPVL